MHFFKYGPLALICTSLIYKASKAIYKKISKRNRYLKEEHELFI